MGEVLKAAAEHKGSCFTEIYQNCPVFNDGAFSALTDKDVKDANQICLQAGEHVRFGVDGERGVAMGSDGQLRIVDVAEVGEDALLVHDEHHKASSLAFALSRIAHTPNGPTPFGVFRDIERPVYDELMAEQIATAKEKRGEGDLRELLLAGDTWTIS